MTYFVDRGYGFLRGTDAREYFFPRAAAPDWPRQQPIEPGMEATFKPALGPRGLRVAPGSLRLFPKGPPPAVTPGAVARAR